MHWEGMRAWVHTRTASVVINLLLQKRLAALGMEAFYHATEKKNCTILVKSKTRKRLWLQAYYLITLILWFLDPT